MACIQISDSCQLQTAAWRVITIITALSYRVAWHIITLVTAVSYRVAWRTNRMVTDISYRVAWRVINIRLLSATQSGMASHHNSHCCQLHMAAWRTMISVTPVSYRVAWSVITIVTVVSYIEWRGESSQ